MTTMSYSILDDLPNILERFTLRYIEWRGLWSRHDINCGDCFIWAWHVYKFLHKRGIEAKLVSCISHGGHAWIEIGDTAYDSDNPEGVYNEDMIYGFVGGSDEDEDEIEVFTMDEEEFLDHWSYHGRSGYLLMDDEFMDRIYRSICQCGRGWKNNRKTA